MQIFIFSYHKAIMVKMAEIVVNYNFIQTGERKGWEIVDDKSKLEAKTSQRWKIKCKEETKGKIRKSE